MNLASQGTYIERCKLYLPSYTLPPVSRPTDSTDGVVVLPLFQAWMGRDPEYHINSALWVYHSFLQNSDIIDRRIPIVFYLDTACWLSEDVQAMFRNAHIPEENIVLFEPSNRTISTYYLGMKMYPLWDERFDKFGNVLIWDTDLFVASPSDEKVPMEILLRREKRSQPAALHVNPEGRKPFRLYETHRLQGAEAKQRQDEIMLDLCGQVYEEGGYSIGGCVHSFCPGEIKQSYKDFYRNALTLIGDDEMILSLWSLHEGEEVECLDPWYPPMAYETTHQRGFIENEQPFLCHLWVESVENNADIRDWKSVIGFRKRTNIYQWTDWDRQELSRTHIDPLSYDPPVQMDCPIQPIVAYINLARRTDRRENFETAIREKGYTGEIHRIDGLDQNGFDDYESLVRFAMKKYPIFENFLDSEFSTIGYRYSQMEALQWILCQDKHVILFEDDITLRCNWDETVKRINYLPSNFKIAQLNYNHRPSQQKTLPYYDRGWEIGIKSNGTTCNVYPPRGAQILYDALMSSDQNSVEMTLSMLELEGAYSASPILAVTIPNSGVSDVTTRHGSDTSPIHTSQKKKITFDGHSGAGKNTQGELLEKRIGDDFDILYWFYSQLDQRFSEIHTLHRDSAPDLSFWINTSYVVSAARMHKREGIPFDEESWIKEHPWHRDWDNRNDKFLDKLKEVLPNFHVLDGLLPPETIHEEIIAIIERTLPN